MRTTKEMWALAQRNCYKGRVNKTPCTVSLKEQKRKKSGMVPRSQVWVMKRMLRVCIKKKVFLL